MRLLLEKSSIRVIDISDDESESDETESSVTESETTVVDTPSQNLTFVQGQQAPHTGPSIIEQLSSEHKKKFTYVVYHGRQRGVFSKW